MRVTKPCPPFRNEPVGPISWLAAISRWGEGGRLFTAGVVWALWLYLEVGGGGQVVYSVCCLGIVARGRQGVQVNQKVGGGRISGAQGRHSCSGMLVDFHATKFRLSC